MDSAEVFLFHFMLRCVRVFGEETGKTRRKGGVFGEEQLNGGLFSKLSNRSDNENRISFFFFELRKNVKWISCAFVNFKAMCVCFRQMVSALVLLWW